jgi:hypothetical protein
MILCEKGMITAETRSALLVPHIIKQVVATPLLEECEDDTHTPEMGTWESSGTPKNSEFNCRG